MASNIWDRGKNRDTLAQRLQRDRRGSVAVMTALMVIPLIMVIGIAIEFTNWTMVTSQLQRTADVSALSGVAEYALAGNAKNAAYAAANVAELNGIVGATTFYDKIWNPATQTLNDNQIVSTVGSGVRTSNRIGVSVTVTRDVPLVFARLMSSLSAVTISASGWAEAKGYNQPCILALGPSVSGVNASGIPRLNAPSCTVRSNTVISTGGAAQIVAAALYANGSITGSGISGPQFPNSASIPDPYANNTSINNAFIKVNNGGQGRTLSRGENPTPGVVYSGWLIQANANLVPGIYYVDGSITMVGQGLLTGTGVTIITSGPISISGGASLALVAALNGDKSGALPGILIASPTSSSIKIVGTSVSTFEGVVYLPRSDVTFSGTSLNGPAGCLEIVANSVTLSGTTTMTMGSNCSAFGALAFSSDTVAPGSLVQ